MTTLQVNTKTRKFRLGSSEENKAYRDKWKNNRVVQKAKSLGVTPEKIFEICFGWQHGQVEFAKYKKDIVSSKRNAVIPDAVLKFCSSDTICSKRNCNAIIDRKNGAFVRDIGKTISIYCSLVCMGFKKSKQKGLYQ